MAGKPNAARVGEPPAAARVAGWETGHSARPQDAGMNIGLRGEEDAPTAGVVLLARSGGGVPEAAGQVAVGRAEELVAMRLVLANEDDPGRLAPVEPEKCVATTK